MQGEGLGMSDERGRISVALGLDVKQRLLAFAELEGATASDVIREAVNERLSDTRRHLRETARAARRRQQGQAAESSFLPAEVRLHVGRRLAVVGESDGSWIVQDLSSGDTRYVDKQGWADLEVEI